jgi:hypothetical protein
MFFITHGCSSANPGYLDMASAKCCQLRSKARRAANAVLPPIVRRGWVGEDQVGKKGWAKLGDGIAASVVACKGAIEPFAKWSDGLAWANGIGGAAGGPYSPPMVAEVGGEYVVLPG